MQSNQETPADAEGVGQPKREASLAAPNGYAATVVLDISGHGTRLRGKFPVARARKLARFQFQCIEDAAHAENPTEYEI